MARSHYIVILVAMPIVTSQILKYVDFTKTQNLGVSRTKHFFLWIKKFTLHIKGYYGKNNFVVEITFNKTNVQKY